MRNITKGGNLKHDRLIHLLDSKTVNIKVLAQVTGIPEYKFNDARRKDKKQVRLSDDDLNKCIVEIKRLKIDIARTFEKFSPLTLKRLLNNPLIVYSLVVNDYQLKNKISYLRKGKSEPDITLWEQLKDKYLVFAITLNI